MTGRSKIQVNTEKCMWCNFCADHCPVMAIKIVNKRFVFDLSKCMYCKFCEDCCPVLAIKCRF